ncbi:MAG: hypothetical protein ACFNM8_01355 [Prevotella histicola]|uniref:hypothetical protein n=1 Tax=Prevotella histicola TaxID=470565 RepID=UPI003620235B
MSTKIEKSDFTFLFAGYGHYKVTYQSPKTGKKWTKTLDDMPLIDVTKNEEYPKRKDLEILRRRVKA